jgi:hypothetical protein
LAGTGIGKSDLNFFRKDFLYLIFELWTERPSSVRVPVLSKTIIDSLPATLIFDESIQKIWHCFSLFKEKRMPIDMTIGNSGGIARVKAVIMFIIMFHGEWYLNKG